MMIEAFWIGAITVPLLVVPVLGTVGLSAERLRSIAVVCACASLVAGAQVFLIPELAVLRISWPWDQHPLFGDSILRVTELSAPLVVLPAALWLVTVAVTPRARLDRRGLQRTALAAAVATTAFLTESPVLLTLFWALSNLLFVRALSLPEHQGARRIASYYLWTSVALLAAGVALTAFSRDALGNTVGLWMILVAVLIRKGIFPFHAWIPHVFDQGRLGPILLFSAPQLGAYTAAVLLVPHGSFGMLRSVAILCLVTAVYGAALALVQRDARRACGYLFVSQSALVLAGLDCSTTEALAGSLVLWISSALAFTGMARTVLALEARRGRLDLSKHHGGYEQMPLLAASFLVLGLACTGFPGTLGFVGQELLIAGALIRFPTMGLLVVVASALTGIAVLRMYFSLFCGSGGRGIRLVLRRREAIVLGALAVGLLVAGLLPRSVVDSRVRAADAIIMGRSHLQDKND